ncbi:uncharacterized protein LOC109798141 isoform X2 [Cajanus cajan]|uniref:TNF receptor-associated factor 5 n=2 Tax=Cajanus cajan TaxID=3821 RepID=A0A151TXA5_CAJCA|nr:uncharacterized protein LOC109798141 isoform X2 [Cajanus cajan]KYP71648.1 TNF receptor-associated factor 5 [Cajanus cajan]
MDMPTIDVELGPEKLEDEKQAGPLLHCDLCDTEVVHKLAQMFLPGLGSACVDNTSGDLFKTPGSVAVDLRKEMIEYVTQRSESFVAESVILEGGPDGEESDHPFDIISNFVDDFVSLKRNLFSRVSGWLLSEKREDKIDDFVQEMEMNGFWTLDRRETIAETLLKNVDFENKYHCSMSFNSAEELANHVDSCNFRSVICENEGCNSRFCAAHLKNHDSSCPFKIISCEQKCSASVMRRDMDRHCITVCPMKIVNCPFYAVGCRSAVAQCQIEKHRSDEINSHLWHLLKGTYKEASGDDLTRRVEQIVQASSGNRLAEARDVRSLNFIVKDIEAKLGPFEMTPVEKNSAVTVAKDGDKEGGETDTIVSERSMKASDVNSSDKAEVSDMVNMNNAENTTKNEGSELSPVEKKGSEERIQTSDKEYLSDKTEIGPLTDENKDAAAGELKIEGNEASTKKHMEKLSNEEVSAKNEASADNSIKLKSNEDSKFEDKDKEQRIDNSEKETKDGAENNVENKESGGDELKKNIHTSEVTKSGAENNVENKESGSDELKKNIHTSEVTKSGAENNVENKESGSDELKKNIHTSEVTKGGAENNVENKESGGDELKKSIHTSEVTKGGAQNNVKNKESEDDDLKKSTNTLEV